MEIITKPLKILLKIMRLSICPFLLSIACATFVMAYDGKGQELLNQRISLHLENKEIEVVLKQISRQASVRFIYSPQIIQSDRRVSIKAQNEPLSVVLETLFKPLKLNYELSGSKILLSNAKQGSSMTVPEAREQLQVAPEELAVKGSVLDEKGEPLPGVSISLKNSGKGTVTDVEGKFSLTVPNESAVLQVRFVGYESQEIVVGKRSEISITLKPDLKELEEVVVVRVWRIEEKRSYGGSCFCAVERYCEG